MRSALGGQRVDFSKPLAEIVFLPNIVEGFTGQPEVIATYTE